MKNVQKAISGPKETERDITGNKMKRSQNTDFMGKLFNQCVDFENITHYGNPFEITFK